MELLSEIVTLAQKRRLQELEPMTDKDSFVIGDVVGQHAGKGKVNSGHIGESA